LNGAVADGYGLGSAEQEGGTGFGTEVWRVSGGVLGGREDAYYR
jgi:hypothetical protein